MADKSVFTRLKRLFSTDVIIRNQGGNNVRVIDVNHIQTTGEIETNSLQDRFNRIYSSTNPSSLYGAQFNLNYQYLRTQMYSEYDVMDTDAIIASALDIIADESTLKNEQGEVLQIVSSDEDVQKILYNLFYDVLNIEFNMWSWVRQMCKYGDFFLKLEIADKFGVYNIIPYTAYHIERQEGYDKASPASIRYAFSPDGFAGGSYGYYNLPNQPTNSNRIYFDNYEMAHFRLLSDVNYLPYGRAYIEPARKLYKQYSLMEDSMLIHRIVRAPEKRVFYINIGGIPPNEVETFMQKTISAMKRTPYIDPETGEYNLKYNMQNMMEDFYIPVRGNDATTKIDTSKGLEYDGIKDVEYLRDKMFAALKVPKAFMGYEKDLCISPETQIPLLDGRTLTAQEIINEFNEGKKNYVYSIDEETKNIVPGEIEWAGFTRMDTQTLKVWLDNGEFIQCTPDHLFLTRDGEWKEAQNLVENESLMPLYLRQSTQKKINGYTEVYNPSTGKYEFVHRLVANHYDLKQADKVIHHKDCNKLNNNPENLDCSMDFWEHRAWHITHTQLCHTPEAKIKRTNTWLEKMKDPKQLKKSQDICKENSKKLVSWIKENGASRKGFVKNPKGICVGCKIEFNKVSLLSGQRNNVYCSQSCMRLNWKSKYKNISSESLIDSAKECVNFKELKSKLNIKDHNTLRKVLQFNGFETDEFIIKYMPKSHSNIYFMNQFPKTNEFYINNFHPEHHEWKEKYSYKNHKVSKIEWIEEFIDTCDLTITKFHNFGTSSGVIIHNSGKATLAAEDIRFARTIDRIQRIILSELEKIALIHLYTQGYDGEQLTNFKLSLTTPSIIYDQERLSLLKEKVDLAVTIFENDVLPSDWVYTNVFHLSESEFGEMRDLNVEDAKRRFRLKQISEEGNDPLETGKSYGTPHDLATLYGTGRYDNTGDVPAGYNEKATLGRPEEKSSNINTQGNAFGRDRLGVAAMKKDDQPSFGKTNYKGGSPLALEGTKKSYFQNRKLLENMKVERKIMIFESDKNKESLLDDSQLRD